MSVMTVLPLLDSSSPRSHAPLAPASRPHRFRTSRAAPDETLAYAAAGLRVGNRPDAGGDVLYLAGRRGRGQPARRGGQLRPAMTPPSTFQIAPVIQLVDRDEPLVDRGGYHGRGDRVDPDLVRGQLDGQVVGQRVQPGLGHRVRRGRGGG